MVEYVVIVGPPDQVGRVPVAILERRYLPYWACEVVAVIHYMEENGMVWLMESYAHRTVLYAKGYLYEGMLEYNGFLTEC